MEHKTAAARALHKSHSRCFPRLLHYVLEEVEKDGLGDSTIGWSSTGQEFIIHNQERFMEEIAPIYFTKQTKFRSFCRQLNLWGFQRHSKETRGVRSAWHHEFFRKGRHDLISQMKRCDNKAAAAGTIASGEKASTRTTASTKKAGGGDGGSAKKKPSEKDKKQSVDERKVSADEPRKYVESTLGSLKPPSLPPLETVPLSHESATAKESGEAWVPSGNEAVATSASFASTANSMPSFEPSTPLTPGHIPINNSYSAEFTSPQCLQPTSATTTRSIFGYNDYSANQPRPQYFRNNSTSSIDVLTMAAEIASTNEEVCSPSPRAGFHASLGSAPSIPRPPYARSNSNGTSIEALTIAAEMTSDTSFSPRKPYGPKGKFPGGYLMKRAEYDTICSKSLSNPSRNQFFGKKDEVKDCRGLRRFHDMLMSAEGGKNGFKMSEEPTFIQPGKNDDSLLADDLSGDESDSKPLASFRTKKSPQGKTTGETILEGDSCTEQPKAPTDVLQGSELLRGISMTRGGAKFDQEESAPMALTALSTGVSIALSDFSINKTSAAPTSQTPQKVSDVDESE